MDCVSPAVAWYRSSFRQGLAFELVHQINHRGFINLQNLDELLLGQRSAK